MYIRFNIKVLMSGRLRTKKNGDLPTNLIYISEHGCPTIVCLQDLSSPSSLPPSIYRPSLPSLSLTLLISNVLPYEEGSSGLVAVL